MIQPIKTNGPVMALSFHPSKPMLLAGLFSGDLALYQYQTTDMATGNQDSHMENDAVTLVHTEQARHAAPIRALLVSQDGQKLTSIGADGSIQSSDFSSTKSQVKFAKTTTQQGVPLSALCALNDSLSLFATGNEDGCLEIWDEKSPKTKSVMKYSDHTDYISDLAFIAHKKTLVSGGGDGMVHVYDIRKNKCKASCDSFEEEILNLALIKGGRKMVAGMSDGSMNIFDYDLWGAPVDRFLGHPCAVDSLVVVDDAEGIICTGASDGLVRLCQVAPNAFLGLVADSNPKRTDAETPSASDIELPLASLAISSDSKLLAGTHYEDYIYLWNDHLTLLQDSGEDSSSDREENEDEDDAGAGAGGRDDDGTNVTGDHDNASDSDSSNSSRSDSEDEKSTKSTSHKKRKGFDKNDKLSMAHDKKKAENAAFFADLL